MYEKQLAWKRLDRKKNPEKYRSWNYAYYTRNPRAKRAEQMRALCGITLAQFDSQVIKQQGRCAICNIAADLVIDHCHGSKRFRGLLCSECNLGLGKFKDNPEALEAAARYLREN